MRSRIVAFLFIFPLLFSTTHHALAQNSENGQHIETYLNERENLKITERYVNFTGGLRADLTRSYLRTNLFSAHASSPYFWMKLRDSQGNTARGIKVSRIEMIQNDTVVARTNDVWSHSLKGEYSSNQFKLINRFNNPNGENLVDLVMYLGSKEVARLEDFRVFSYEKPMVQRVHTHNVGVSNPKFQLSLDTVNVPKGQKTDAYLVDEDRKRITYTDKITTDSYNENDETRRIHYALSFMDEKYLIENTSYEYVVEVNGTPLDTHEKSTIRVISNPSIDVITHPTMPELTLNVSGTHLVKQGPFKLVIEQEGTITKELNDIEAEFNEFDYTEEIKVDLPPEYFKSHGDMYTAKLFAPNQLEMLNFDFLVPVDDTSQAENDVVDPYEGFKVFDKKINIPTSKKWRVEFNRALDENTINNGNMYIIHKETGKLVDVKYGVEKEGTILTMMPEKNFKPGERYRLIIDKRAKAKDGALLEQPATLEFTVGR